MTSSSWPALVVSLLAATGSVAAATPGWMPQEGTEWLGRAAPEWRGLRWLDREPLSLARLRGRVVLVRFWTRACAYCATSAPALVALDERYRARGLTVVGIHHPKSEESRGPEAVRAAARALGFRFPIAIDDEWETVRAYGVGGTFRRFTSISFLIDRAGIVRFVHDGGEIHAGAGAGHEACDAAHGALVEAIEECLGDGAH